MADDRDMTVEEMAAELIDVGLASLGKNPPRLNATATLDVDPGAFGPASRL